MRLDNNRLLGDKELRAYLGISKPSLARLRKKGAIPFIKVGNLCKYSLVEVMDALKENSTN